MSKRKYLVAEEQAIKDAKVAYTQALAELQSKCPHDVVLEHIDDRYEMFRVCEQCGVTCRARWSSSVYAYGETSILDKRAYKVNWPTFAKTAPAVGGWCQR